MRTILLLVYFLVLPASLFCQNIDNKIEYIRNMLPKRYNIDFKSDTTNNRYCRNGKRLGVLKISDSNSAADTLDYFVYKAFGNIDSLKSEIRSFRRYSNCIIPFGCCMDFEVKDCFFSLPYCSHWKNRDLTIEFSKTIRNYAESKFDSFYPKSDTAFKLDTKKSEPK